MNIANVWTTRVFEGKKRACPDDRWDDSIELEHNSETAAVADQLFKELRTFVIPEDFDLKVKVVEAYICLATRSKSKIDQAMQIFIDILEKEKD